MKNLDHYLEQAIGNIEEDRKITRELLDDVVRYLSKNEENHRSVGLTAAKYVETLQRSNAQLVSVATMIQKEQEKNADPIGCRRRTATVRAANIGASTRANHAAKIRWRK